MLSTSAIGMSKPTSVYKTNHWTLLLVAVAAVAAVAAVTVVAAVAAVAAVTVVAGHVVISWCCKKSTAFLEKTEYRYCSLRTRKLSRLETRPKRCCLSLSVPKQGKEQG